MDADAWDPNERLIAAAIASAIEPPERLWFDEWADRYLRVERSGQIEPWVTDKTPWNREIMRELSPWSPTTDIAYQKPNQVGATVLGFGYVLYRAHQSPTTIGYVLPNMGVAEDMSRGVFQRLIDNCEAVRDLFVTPKSRDSGNTIGAKMFAGGGCYLRGAESAAGLASLPLEVVEFDEADRSKWDAGKEGDPRALANNRTVTFERAKRFTFSTPGDKRTSRIEPLFIAGSQGRWMVPCPRCGAYTILRFEHMQWPDRAGDAPLYKCPACLKLWDESAKPQIQLRGRWEHQHPERPSKSYKLGGLNSLTKWGYLDEVRRSTLTGNLHALRVYVNVNQGETFDLERATAIDATGLTPLIEPIAHTDGQPIIPLGVGILTAGADTQGDRLEVVLYGWGVDGECWHLAKLVIRGDTTLSGPGSVWAELEQWRRRTWQNARGHELRLTALHVDYGGLAGEQVAEFVRGKSREGVRAIRGKGGEDRRVWPNRTNKGKWYSTELYEVGTHRAKTQIYGWIKHSLEAHRKGSYVGGAGIVHIASQIVTDDEARGMDYLRGLVSESPVTTTNRSGAATTKWETHTEGLRNEPLDCAVYGYSAFMAWMGSNAGGAGVLKHLVATLSEKNDSVPHSSHSGIGTSSGQAWPRSQATPPQPPPGTDPWAGQKAPSGWDSDTY